MRTRQQDPESSATLDDEASPRACQGRVLQISIVIESRISQIGHGLWLHRMSEAHSRSGAMAIRMGEARPPRRSRDDGTAAHPGRDGPVSKNRSERGLGVGARRGRRFGIGICGGDRSQTDQCQSKTGGEPVTYPIPCARHRLAASRIRNLNALLDSSPAAPDRSGTNRSEVSRSWFGQGDAERARRMPLSRHERG